MARITVLLLAAVLSTPCSALVEVVFNQSEAVSVYTSVGTTILANGKAFFAVADGLNAVRRALLVEVAHGSVGR